MLIPNCADLGRMADDVARALSHSVAIESAEFEVVWCLSETGTSEERVVIFVHCAKSGTKRR